MSDSKINFERLFDDFVSANSKTWAHDRDKSVGASEAFDCIRKVWFRKRGAEFGFEPDNVDERSWGATQRGDLLEAHFVVPAVANHLPAGAELLYAGDGQQTLFSGYNSATPDGIITGLASDALANYGIPDIKSDCIMLEIKSIDPRVSLHEEKAVHRGQTQVQMGLVRETSPYQPYYAVILYVNASFLDDIKVFVVEYDEAMWTVAKSRADTVFAGVDPAALPPEGRFDNACKYCPFKAACSLVQIGSIPDDNSKAVAKEERWVDEFTPALEEYKRKQQAAKDAERDFEEAKEAIREKLREANTRKVGVKGAWSVSWYQQKGQKRLNRAAIMERLGVSDLEEFMEEGDPFDVLRVNFSG